MNQLHFATPPILTTKWIHCDSWRDFNGIYRVARSPKRNVTRLPKANHIDRLVKHGTYSPAFH
jgi:hypothetical protein